MVTEGKSAKIFFVGGINGAGKSSLLKIIESKNPKFTVIRGSERFMKWLKLKPGDYDTLRSLPVALKNREIGNMMRHIVRQYSKSKNHNAILMDAHYLRIHDGRITNAVGSWMSLLDGLFLITANPSNVVRRIENDPLNSKRDRVLWKKGATKAQKLKFLKKCITLSVDTVKRVSRKYDIPYWVIRNDGALKDTARGFTQIIKSQITK